MTEDLKGRVRHVTYDAGRNLLSYSCRAATLDGRAVDFEFALGNEDERTQALQPGSRVTYSTRGKIGVWGRVLVPGFVGYIPVDAVTMSKAGQSYRDALFREGGPPPGLLLRAKREAEAMGYTVNFDFTANSKTGVSDWYVEVGVPGRGNMKFYRANGVSWEELMTTAGLGGTL